MKQPTGDPSNFGNRPGDGPLRPNGQSTGIPQSDANLPSARSIASKRQVDAVVVCRDLVDGQMQLHDKGQDYLPKEPGEDSTDYKCRLNRSVFFNAYGSTVDGLTGFVFRKDPVLGDDVPVLIKGTDNSAGHWENIDLAGTHGDVFLRQVFADALTAGHAAILVDYPATGGVQTLRDESGNNPFPVRPYWVPIRKEDILSWRTTTINGNLVLTQIVIKEALREADGAFGDREVEQYRVLYRDDNGSINFKVLRVTENKVVIVVTEGKYPTQNEIPIAEIPTSGRKGLFESEPPLLDLAHLNIAHYQMWSDYANSIHKTNVPIFFMAGVQQQNEDGTPQTLVLGANTAITSPDPQAKASYVSHDGAALGASKMALDDLKSDMATLGIAMLSSQKRVAETAAAKRIDKSATDSALGVTARGLQDGVERALGYHARYLKQPDGGSVTINRDFENLIMDAQVMSAYADLGAKLGLPLEVILRQLQLGGRLEEDDDIESIALQAMSNQAAAQQQQAQQQADAMAQPQPSDMHVINPDGTTRMTLRRQKTA